MNIVIVPFAKNPYDTNTFAMVMFKRFWRKGSYTWQSYFVQNSRYFAYNLVKTDIFV